MELILGNPWGLLGLLGLPAILAIHLLQRRSVIIPASTLFLLEKLSRESQGGRRVERLRSSLPLWLQLLSVLLLTWLLTDPRWLEKTSLQRIAVVLDGSASMSVSKKTLLESLPRDLEKLTTATARTELHLLDTRLETGPLYHGPEGAALLRMLGDWHPSGGTHDPAPSLRLARSLVGTEGLVLFVTDTEPPALPPNVRLYAVGRPVGNVGFAGINVEEDPASGTLWRATLRNYTQEIQTREFQVLNGKQVVTTATLTIPPLAVIQQKGPFPTGIDFLSLTISPDAFVMDDTAPVLRPRLKEVTVSLPTDPNPDPASGPDAYAALFNSLPGVRPVPTAADIPVIAYNPLNPAIPDGPAIIFVRDPKPAAKVLPGTLLVETHPLTEGLGWNALICQDSLRIPLRQEDRPLIWIGDRAVLFLRTSGTATQLCFNFDIAKSNARRLPALVLTIHRWLEDYRRQLPAEEWTLTECGQLLDIAPFPAPAEPQLSIRPEDAPITLRPVREAALLRTRAEPGFLEIWQGDRRLLRTATAFADVREADFSACLTKHDLTGVSTVITRQHSNEDPAWRAWLLALLALLGLSWWLPSKKSRTGTGTAGPTGPAPPAPVPGRIS
ncbi:MAG: hypothetical protein JWL81_2452 [Verrucomicrobiales bacterium]|nr:hypothetical protein [Verrucomicrobiales bacterium]